LPALAPRASDARRGRQHLAEVEAVADGMLARLDELTATLGMVRALTTCGDACCAGAPHEHDRTHVSRARLHR
jgi:hypothetical protein